MAGAKTCSGSLGRSVSVEPGKIYLIHRAETFSGQVVVPGHAIHINHQPFTIPVEDGAAYGGNHSRSARLRVGRGEIYDGGTEKKNVKKQDPHPQAILCI